MHPSSWTVWEHECKSLNTVASQSIFLLSLFQKTCLFWCWVGTLALWSVWDKSIGVSNTYLWSQRSDQNLLYYFAQPVWITVGECCAGKLLLQDSSSIFQKGVSQKVSCFCGINIKYGIQWVEFLPETHSVTQVTWWVFCLKLLKQVESDSNCCSHVPWTCMPGALHSPGSPPAADVLPAGSPSACPPSPSCAVDRSIALEDTTTMLRSNSLFTETEYIMKSKNTHLTQRKLPTIPQTYKQF